MAEKKFQIFSKKIDGSSWMGPRIVRILTPQKTSGLLWENHWKNEVLWGRLEEKVAQVRKSIDQKTIKPSIREKS